MKKAFISIFSKLASFTSYLAKRIVCWNLDELIEPLISIIILAVLIFYNKATCTVMLVMDFGKQMAISDNLM